MNNNKEGNVHGTPTRLLTLSRELLTDYERQEILDYEFVYFIGSNLAKFDFPEKDHNPIFTRDDGFYDMVLNDHIAYRYEVLDIIGEGSFSQVLEVFDHKDKVKVALKITKKSNHLYSVFLEERRMLLALKDLDPTNQLGIVHIIDSFKFRGHLCHTFNLMYLNLNEVMKRTIGHKFEMSIIKQIARSILYTLAGLNRHGIIHGDLKPQNIVLEKEGDFNVKIIDFGTSSFATERKYFYLQSRPYRAPEVIFRQAFDTNIDIWSVGCILAECYTGRVLFPAMNECELMACIMEMLGYPPSRMLIQSNAGHTFVTKGRANYCYYENLDGSFTRKECITFNGRRMGTPGARPLENVLNCEDKKFVDFLKKCLVWEPKLRLQPADALEHPWLFEPPVPTKSDSEENGQPVKTEAQPAVINEQSDQSFESASEPLRKMLKHTQ